MIAGDTEFVVPSVDYVFHAAALNKSLHLSFTPLLDRRRQYGTRDNL